MSVCYTCAGYTDPGSRVCPACQRAERLRQQQQQQQQEQRQQQQEQRRAEEKAAEKVAAAQEEVAYEIKKTRETDTFFKQRDGTPLMVQAEQAGQLEMAALEIETTASNEAARMRQQAVVDRMTGKAAARAGGLGAVSTVLGTAGSLGSTYGTQKKLGVF